MLTCTAAFALALPTAFLVGALYPPQLVLIFNPRYSPPPPTADSKHGKSLMEETERELQELFVVAKMRNKEEWYETREFFPSGLWGFCLFARPGRGCAADVGSLFNHTCPHTPCVNMRDIP